MSDQLHSTTSAASATPPCIGLALSGGGYRAAAFHLGTLRKLHELGRLAEVDVLSTISGGSITGAAYCLHQGPFEEFYSRMQAALGRCNVLRHVFTCWPFVRFVLLVLALLLPAAGLLFTRWAPAAPLPLLLLLGLLARYQFRLLPVSELIERAYEAFFFQGRTLDQLPARPLLALGASNLQTGRPFTFSRDWMGDSTYTYAARPARFVAAGFPIARAVAASSCVPFAFTPVRLARAFYQQPADADRPDVQPQLIDGGVYDNQGLHKLTQPGSRYACHTLLVSDAGAGLGLVATYPNTVALLLRTVDLFMQRIRNVQLMDQRFRPAAEGPQRSIAYLALDGRLEQVIPDFIEQLGRGQVPAAVVAARQLRPEWVREPARYREQLTQHLAELVGYAQVAARDLTPAERAVVTSVGTNLTPLTPTQLTLLSRQAENLTELQVKLYWPAPARAA